MIAQNSKSLIAAAVKMADSQSKPRWRSRLMPVLVKIGAAIRRDFERADKIHRQVETLKQEAREKYHRYEGMWIF